MRLAQSLALFTALQATLPAMAQPPQDENERAYMTAGCYQCHGTLGQGGVGPRLAPRPLPLPAMAAFVRNAARNMPPYPPQVLSEADLERIHAYLSGVAPSPTVQQIPQLR
jgi:ubiquinol-cytochrome c reductase cytochrome c subunit